MVVPEDTAVREEEEEKLDKYQDLERDVGKMLRVQAVPLVIGQLRTTSRRLESNLRCTGVDIVTAAERDFQGVSCVFQMFTHCS